MKKPDVFTFITMTTGHAGLSARRDVSDEVIKRIGAALGGDGALWGGWSVKHGLDRGHARFEMANQGYAVSAGSVCWAADAAAEAWAQWLDRLEALDAPMQPVRQPPAPWLAVALIPEQLTALGQQLGAAQLAQLMLELGDAERCVAWAIIERHGRAS
jgi:hypothetical protein